MEGFSDRDSNEHDAQPECSSTLYELRNEETGEHHFFDDIAAALEAAKDDIPQETGWTIFECEEGGLAWVASRFCPSER